MYREANKDINPSYLQGNHVIKAYAYMSCGSLRRAYERGGQCPALDVNAAEVPVLGTSAIVTLTRQTENTKMPIRSIG